MRLAEVIGFGTLAIGIHIGGLWYVLDARTLSGDDGGAGENGQESISLMIDGGTYQDLINAWETPPETQIEMAALAVPKSQDPLAHQSKTPDTAIPTLPSPELRMPTLDSPIAPPNPMERLAVAPPAVQQLVLPSLNTEAPALSTAVAIDTSAPSALAQRPNPMRPTVQPSIDQTTPDAPAFSVDTVAPASAKRPPARPNQRTQPVAPKVVQKAKGVSTNKTTNNTAGSSAKPSQTSQSAGREKQAISEWSSGVRRAIERKKRYPRGTRASGTVIISLTVSRSGSLLGAKVNQSSGTDALDKAALKAVQTARFPAAPKDVARDSATFQVPITLKR